MKKAAIKTNAPAQRPISLQSIASSLNKALNFRN